MIESTCSGTAREFTIIVTPVTARDGRRGSWRQASRRSRRSATAVGQAQYGSPHSALWSTEYPSTIIRPPPSRKCAACMHARPLDLQLARALEHARRGELALTAHLSLHLNVVARDAEALRSRARERVPAELRGALLDILGCRELRFVAAAPRRTARAALPRRLTRALDRLSCLVEPRLRALQSRA